jgi:thermitase
MGPAKNRVLADVRCLMRGMHSLVSLARRLWPVSGVLLATLVGVMVLQGAQEARASTENPLDSAADGKVRSSVLSEDQEFAKGQIIIKLEDGATQADLAALNRRNDARTKTNLPGSAVNVVDLPSSLTVTEAVQRYEASPKVQYAEPDYLLQPAKTPDDRAYGMLWGLNNTGQDGGIPDADIDAPEAWNTATGSPDTVVAVIDTGVDIYHPDLDDNVWTNPDEIAGNGIDDDKNGYVDDVHGWDFFHHDPSVYDAADGDEHGTHVAGTIAAEGNNSIGVTGVAWHAKVMVLKYLGPNGGYASDAVEAINYAVREGATISNNSWGGGAYSQALHDAISRADAAGLLFVASAGNDGSNNDTTPHYPSNYDLPNVISVAATGYGDALAPFSNYGVNSVDLAAPGISVLGPLPGDRYGRYSGTSMATPYVTGVAALLKSQHPELTDEQLKAQVLNFTEKKTDLAGKTLTGGRLNAAASLTQQAAPDEIRPTVWYAKPGRNSRTHDRSPTISATVRDDRTELAATNMRLYLDGRARHALSYDAVSDQLSYTCGRLTYAWHTVKIVVKDAAGNTVTKKWRFQVAH